MFQFNCQTRDAAESYEVFQYARHWAGEFMELVIVIDDRTGLYHTWIEFENAELYFPHFRIGEKSLGSESLIELLVDLGSEQVIAEEEVRQCKYYLSVSWFNEMVEDPETGQKAVRELLRCFRVPPDRQRKRSVSRGAHIDWVMQEMSGETSLYANTSSLLDHGLTFSSVHGARNNYVPARRKNESCPIEMMPIRSSRSTNSS